MISEIYEYLYSKSGHTYLLNEENIPCCLIALLNLIFVMDNDWSARTVSRYVDIRYIGEMFVDEGIEGWNIERIRSVQRRNVS